MNSSISLFPGATVGGESWLHRLDARSKFLVVVLVIALSLLTHSIWTYLSLLALLVITMLAAGISGRGLLGAVRPLAVLLIVTLGFHVLFGEQRGEELLYFGGWSLTAGQLVDAAYYSLRLLILVAVALLLALTSSPADIADGAVKLIRPLGRLGLPINDIGLILFIALRFVPILRDEFVAIRQAQTMRGVQFSSGSLVARVGRSSTLLIPVFLAALNRADELALAIQARGFRSRAVRTNYSHHRFGAAEFLFILGSSLLLALLYRIFG